jgi:hypothetical protein
MSVFFHAILGLALLTTTPDVIGIDVGITLLSAENLRTGRAWQWFMKNHEIRAAMERAGMRRRSAARELVLRSGR